MSGFITYIIVSVFTPGPNNIFSSISTSRVGFKQTLRFMIGVFFGTLLIFVITGLFNLYLYNNIRIITKIIGIVGGLFIIYLAVRMFMSRSQTDKLLVRNNRLLLMGIVLNFINAKTIIFGLTVATYYLELDFSPDYLMLFALLMAILCFVAVVVWGLFGKIFRDLLEKYRTAYNVLMALLLAYSGVLIIVESLS